MVEPFWAVAWKSHVALEISILRAPRTHTMKIVCIQRYVPQAKVAWNENRVVQQAPQGEARREARNQYSKSMWIHEDAELRGASEKVGALYHRWSAAAAEDFRSTMLRTRTVPILPHVAKDESHVEVGGSRIWASVASKIHTIDGLRHSGMRS